MREYLYCLATDKKNGPVAGILKFFLFILSLIYGILVRIMLFGCRLFPAQARCKVIAIGNITVGGTGKTTLAAHIAEFLKSQGHKTAIISRGYKRIAAGMGDEPSMLAGKLPGIPVIVDANRLRGISRAIRDYAVDTVILDDALQQWRIIKDLEIVTIDAANPFGNCKMLPRGILRQPLSTLKDASLFVLTKINLAGELKSTKEALNKLNPAAAIIESVHQPIGFYSLAKADDLLPLQAMKGKAAVLFSGIGDPGSFAAIIGGLGIKIAANFVFADHHQYRAKDLEKIIQIAREKISDAIITTEKDAARLSGLKSVFGKPQVLVLRIQLQITENAQILQQRLLSLYRA
ncbi:MAG: tetraacyldisaccharide 4'-kinase [Candidatus Omnitrophota bacterium]